MNNNQTIDNNKSYEGWFLLIIGGIIFFALIQNYPGGGTIPPQPENIPPVVNNPISITKPTINTPVNSEPSS